MWRRELSAVTPAPVVTVIAPPHGWFDLGLREVWDSREILRFFIWREVKVKYKQTAIGAAWAVIQPLGLTVVFTIFFGRLAQLSTNELPRPLFYYSGLLLWTFFASALTGATNIVVDNQRIITKVYFPRLVLPLAAVLAAVVDLAIASVLAIGMLAFYGIEPTAAMLLAPVFVLMALVTALAVGLWFSALNAMYRDVRYAVPFLLQFWLFASPVVYSSSLLPEEWQWVYGLNPLAGVIEGLRWALSGQNPPQISLLLASIAGVMFLLVGGLAYFRRQETTMVDIV